MPNDVGAPRWAGSSRTPTLAWATDHGHRASTRGAGAVLERAGLKLDDIDLFEVNEAFAAQALAVVRELGLPPDRTNPNGSGISLGHPIGATGAILTVKALYELRRTGGRYALVTMCIRGGQGIAAVFERI
jgi:acetyl-CoA C-acetyltransferase